MPDRSLSGGETALVAVILVISLAALVFAAYLVRAVTAADQGTEKMREIARAVQEGAAAYLRRQFRTLAVFAVLVFVVLLLLAAGWWVLKAVLGTVLFFAKLAVLALVVAAVVRAWFWVRGRARRRPEPNL